MAGSFLERMWRILSVLYIYKIQKWSNDTPIAAIINTRVVVPVECLLDIVDSVYVYIDIYIYKYKIYNIIHVLCTYWDLDRLGVILGKPAAHMRSFLSQKAMSRCWAPKRPGTQVHLQQWPP